ncbi:MAG: tRNA (N(6)-L-threonylcarbamoyladenosine(37)-C(2))-methylthiotransferase MtaB [bacterium]|nr:tRNA (N(6)-L-threonylcarbamoyladenosine(37)-C(2))-methylthiotransferase MtaB [bacterium]
MQIHTFGCKVNQVESLKIEELLAGHDVIVINTCTITEKADAKCRNLINRTVRNNPGKKILITGCLVERTYHELKKAYPHLIFLKNENKMEVQQFIDEASEIQQPLETTNLFLQKRNRAFLKIQDGCDHFCSYCIVPYVRSKKWSMPLPEVQQEIKKFVEQGFQEVVLTGVRIGFYHWQNKTFEDVIDLACQNDQLQRIRISSIEPTELTPNIIEKIANNKKICPHLHIALQSGSDQVLKSMGRGYDTKYLTKLVKILRSKIKNLRITTDLITAYPTETDQDFEDTIKLLEDLEIDGIHCFTFSARKGTKAYNIKQRIPEHIIKQRKETIKNFDLKQRIKSATKFINQTTTILTENNDGYTPNYIKVKLPDNKKTEKNKIIKVTPTKIIKKWPIWLE